MSEVKQMGNGLYLLSVTVSGIKNIKKEVQLDFYKKTIDKSFNPDKYRIKAIYGENGSGKSAIITSIKIFKDIVLDNNYLSESKNQHFLEEMINKQTKQLKMKFCFYVYTRNGGIVHNYEMVLGEGRNGIYELKYEKLSYRNGNYPNNHYITVFECKDGAIVDMGVGTEDREYVEKKTLNLLSTHSLPFLFLTNINLEDMAQNSGDKKSVGWLFTNFCACFVFALSMKIYLDEEDQHELYFLKRKLMEFKIDKQSLGEELAEYGKNIDTYLNVNEKAVDKERFIKYEQKVEQLTKFIKIFKPELKNIDIDKKDNGTQYLCDLILNYGSYSINKEFESTGIKKLIRLFDCLSAASQNGIVFIDEMDSNLNDVYLCKLIEYFMEYGKGQLCFTTHNLDPMSVLKRNKNSINFLSNDHHLISWTARGNALPENCFRNGMIEDLPFNIDATDFIGMFGE